MVVNQSRSEVALRYHLRINKFICLKLKQWLNAIKRYSSISTKSFRLWNMSCVYGQCVGHMHHLIKIFTFLKFLLEKAPKEHVNSLNVLYFRAKEKQRKKQKRREALERGDTMAPTRKKLRSNTMAKSSCKTSVVIDCSLDSYMGEKVRQNNLQYIYILFFLINGIYFPIFVQFEN